MQRCIACVISRLGKWLGEILKIAIEIDIFLRHAANVREAIRIERMNIEHGHASSFGFFAPFCIMQRKHLHTRAAIAFHAVASAAHDQHLFGIG